MEKVEYQPDQIVKIPYGAVHWKLEPCGYTWDDHVVALITQVIDEVVDLPGHLQRHSDSISRTITCSVKGRYGISEYTCWV